MGALKVLCEPPGREIEEALVAFPPDFRPGTNVTMDTIDSPREIPLVAVAGDTAELESELEIAIANPFTAFPSTAEFTVAWHRTQLARQLVDGEDGYGRRLRRIQSDVLDT